MSNSEVFVIHWQASDGYVGKDRPQRCKVHLSEFDGRESLEEIKEMLEEVLQCDFEQKVHCDADNLDEVAEQIKAALDKREGAGL